MKSIIEQKSPWLYVIGSGSFRSLATHGNHNGGVDAADYTVWRDSLGRMGSGLAADGDNTGASAGKIDQADYNVWKANFGNHAGSGCWFDYVRPRTVDAVDAPHRNPDVVLSPTRKGVIISYDLSDVPLID
jgi:hypothetical protein